VTTCESEADPVPVKLRASRKLTFNNWALLTFVIWMLVGFAAALLFITAGTIGQRIGVAVMALYASAGVGGLAGFLFAVPKAASDDQRTDAGRRAYRANSNLVQVSDWLTKIIVGVGLIEVRQLADGLGEIATRLGLAFGDPAGLPGVGATFGLTLVLAGALVSFMTTYAWAATRFYEVLVRQEQQPSSEDEAHS